MKTKIAARRGIATAAVRELLREAWAAPEVEMAIAHTLPGQNASVRVLEKTGFAHDGEHRDGDVGIVWRFRLNRGTAVGGVRSSGREPGR